MVPPAKYNHGNSTAAAVGCKRPRESNDGERQNHIPHSKAFTGREYYKGDRMRPLTRVETYFSKEEGPQYCAKVIVKKGKHVENELMLPAHFRFIRFTKDAWGMAQRGSTDRSCWYDAYLYNTDKKLHGLKTLKEYLLFRGKSALGFFPLPGSSEEGMVVVPFDQPPIPEGMASAETDKNHLAYIKYTYNQTIVQREKKGVEVCNSVEKVSDAEAPTQGKTEISLLQNCSEKNCDTGNCSSSTFSEDVSIEDLCKIHGINVLENKVFIIFGNEANI